MKVKLSDVAKASGVSISTVSRVINGDRECPASAKTSDKIWKAVKDLGYVPNKHAKNLVKGEGDDEVRLGRIGCIYTSTFESNNDPFFSCIGLGIQRELSNNNYEMAYSVYAGMMDYTELYSYILKHEADGIIVLGSFNQEIFKMLKKHFDHIVYAGVNSVCHEIDEVICNGFDGAKIALKHLYDMGNRDIGYVGLVSVESVDGNKVNDQRYEAYVEFVNDLGKDRLVIQSKLGTTDAYENMTQYLNQNPKLGQAYYCANDATAFGVMKALQDKGIKVPEDIAIIGLDNVEMSKFVTPRLSTISIPRRALGSRAVQLLIEQIETKRDYPLKVSLPFELILRESSDINRLT